MLKARSKNRSIGAPTRDERSKQAVIHGAYALGYTPELTAGTTLSSNRRLPDRVLAGGGYPRSDSRSCSGRASDSRRRRRPRSCGALGAFRGRLPPLPGGAVRSCRIHEPSAASERAGAQPLTTANLEVVATDGGPAAANGSATAARHPTSATPSQSGFAPRSEMWSHPRVRRSQEAWRPRCPPSVLAYLERSRSSLPAWRSCSWSMGSPRPPRAMWIQGSEREDRSPSPSVGAPRQVASWSAK